MKNHTPLSGGIIAEPPPKVKPFARPEVVTDVDVAIAEDSFIYVHCHFDNKWMDMLIRVWKTTYLVDHGSDARSNIVHVENISFAPQWTLVPNNASYTFLLIFSGLPKSCAVFDVFEDIPMPGGFHMRDIERNQTDVYHVDVF